MERRKAPSSRLNFGCQCASQCQITEQGQAQQPRRASTGYWPSPRNLSYAQSQYRGPGKAVLMTTYVYTNRLYVNGVSGFWHVPGSGWSCYCSGCFLAVAAHLVGVSTCARMTNGADLRATRARRAAALLSCGCACCNPRFASAPVNRARSTSFLGKPGKCVSH